jgi:hypothetical protein
MKLQSQNRAEADESANARTELRALIAAPGACKCPTWLNRRTGLHACPCCGFRGDPVDHLVFSARIAAGDDAGVAARAARVLRKRVNAWYAASGWSPMVDVECWDHVADLPADGQLWLFGGYGPAGRARWNTTAVPEPVRASRSFTYYLGGRPNWLADLPSDVPLMIAAPTLARYRDTESDRFTSRRYGNWFGDSGAFMALTGSGTNRGEVHPWHMHPDSYGALWVRLIMDVGMPDFVAPQDAPCEQVCRDVTGATTREHIKHTVRNYLYLVENFPMVPWLPVIQGETAEDYLYCERLYLEAGVDLAELARVGVGSICRRASVPEIVEVIRLFADKGYRLHGFGVKTEALPIIGHLLWSADSYAWSDTARKEQYLMPGCDHRTRECAKSHGTGCVEHLTDCRNCPRYAQAWRLEVLAKIGARDLLAARVVRVVPAAPDVDLVDIVDGAPAVLPVAWPTPVELPPRRLAARGPGRRRCAGRGEQLTLTP